MRHSERHRGERIGWLRAAVLGADDGIVSTASLIVGVAAAGSARDAILLAGVAGLAAGPLSMAAGSPSGAHSRWRLRLSSGSFSGLVCLDCPEPDVDCACD